MTARSRQSAVSYDWSGFVAEIDPAALKMFGRWRDIDWVPCVEIVNQGLRRRCTFANPRLTGRRPDDRECAPGVLVQGVAARNRFVVQVRRTLGRSSAAIWSAATCAWTAGAAFRSATSRA